MNQQEIETVDYLTTEETEDQDFFAFADLALTDEQLAEVKGGPGTGFCAHCGVVLGNHNETTVSDEAEETEEDFFQFADLSLTDEQLAEIKGGPGSGFCAHCGVILGNHNETTASDEIEETEEDFFQFADLVLTDEQLTEVKGGPGSGWCYHCSVVVGNHNETTVNDETEEAEEDFFQFADLSLTDEQLAEVKGGPGWCTYCGVVYSNHNETTVSDETEEADEDFFQFADLSLTDEQLAEIKGGPGWCTSCAVVYGNHNETTAGDETEETEEDFFQFADLSLTNEQLAEVKGGPGSGWCYHCGVVVGNHNETTASDETEEAETESLDDLPFEDYEQVKGGPSGGITKLGSRRLILQGDGT